MAWTQQLWRWSVQFTAQTATHQWIFITTSIDDHDEEKTTTYFNFMKPSIWSRTCARCIVGLLIEAPSGKLSAVLRHLTLVCGHFAVFISVICGSCNLQVICAVYLLSVIAVVSSDMLSSLNDLRSLSGELLTYLLALGDLRYFKWSAVFLHIVCANFAWCAVISIDLRSSVSELR